MRTKLLRLLALACMLLLATGAVTAGALAESSAAEKPHVIIIEWDDESNLEGFRPASVACKLGGQSVTVTAANNWIATVTTANGTDFSVTEPSGYDEADTTYETDGTGLIHTAKLKHTVSRQTVNVSVVWDDFSDKNGVRPDEVQVQLLANGQPYGTPKTLSGSGDTWSGSWDSLPRNMDGNSITYTVLSASNPTYYDVSESGLTVTYSLVTGTLTVEATSTGAADGTPEAQLQIEISGPDASMPQTVTCSPITGGSWTFNNLLPGAYLARELNTNDLIYDYYIVPEETTRADAVYVGGGERGTIRLRNSWVSSREAPDRERNENPETSFANLTFQILGPDPNLPITISYSDFTNGSYTLTGLLPGSYAVVERNAETLIDFYTLQGDSIIGGTTTLVANVGGDGITLYNHYSPSPDPVADDVTINIPVTKIWADNNNAAGNRPGSITVRLYADGAEIESRDLSEANGWSATFMDLPVYRLRDVPYVYSVKEDPVAMYTSSTTGSAETGLNIVNTYQGRMTSASVRKVWDDNNNAAGNRPTAIFVTLRGGNTTIGTYRLSDANGWAVTVNDLPAIINGAEAVYTWSEQTVAGYVSNMVSDGTTTVFTNGLYQRPPTDETPPPVPGIPSNYLDEYDTPLGIVIDINHVGDCFD